jgi:hypothetical protein
MITLLITLLCFIIGFFVGKYSYIFSKPKYPEGGAALFEKMFGEQIKKDRMSCNCNKNKHNNYYYN